MGAIRLSEKSIDITAKACRTIKFSNPHNDQTIRMANGIALYVQKHGRVSQKQAEWLCRNADYWAIKRPSELASIVIRGRKKFQQSHAEGSPQPTADIELNYSAATALLYAYRGWAVLPLYGIRNGLCRCPKGEDCAQPGKHPRTKNGVKDATTDALMIKYWWTKWPSANIGIATGSVSGIIVIAANPRKGGTESLQAAKEKLGALPITLKAITGGKGRHRIFQHPKTAIRTDTRGKLLGPGVDVLADGSYFVAPGSLNVSGKKYCWAKGKSIRDVTPATLSTSWLERLCSGRDRFAEN